MASTEIWLVGNDMLLRVKNLQNGVSSAYMNAATVTVTLKTVAGVAVAGVSWPVTLAYVTGSNGTYEATVDKAAGVVAETRYFAFVDAAEGGLDFHSEKPVWARVRRD